MLISWSNGCMIVFFLMGMLMHQHTEQRAALLEKKRLQ